MVLTNSIVLGNVSLQTEDDELYNSGAIFTEGQNIVGGGLAGGDGVIDAAAEDVFAEIVDNNGVLAGALGDNGGSVRSIALKADADNPALDAGSSSLATDMTGAPRDVDLAEVDNGGTVDLGAVELQDLTPAVTLWLVNADTDEILGQVPASGVIDPGLLNGAAFSFVAVFANADQVQSAALSLNEAPPQIESVAPYALFGDTDGDFAGQALPTGAVHGCQYRASLSLGAKARWWPKRRST